MGKNKGFSLVELLVVIVLMAILATMTAPNFFETRRKEALRLNSQAVMDLIGEARSNAIANKRCDDAGTPRDSLKWMVIFQPGSQEVRLYCQWSGDYGEQATSDSYDLEVYSRLSEVSAEDSSWSNLYSGTPRFFAISFFAGSVQSKLEDLGVALPANDLTGTRVADMRLLFQYTQDLSHQLAVCIDGVAGFPRINNGSTCLDK